MYTLLYVDDEQDNLLAFQAAFRRDYRVITAESASDALRILSQTQVHIVLSDQRMPTMTGVELLKRVLAEYPKVIRILVTAYSDFDSVIKSINESRIFYYLPKPWIKEDVKQMIHNALELYELREKNQALMDDLQKSNESLLAANKAIDQYRKKLELENDYLKKSSSVSIKETGVGQSAPFKRVLEQIDQVARTTTTVLIQGETGTGKELMASRIQQLSSRASKPFVKINCAAFPLNLIESELFGYEKGAFSGANTAKAGLFEIADGGTLFLDEIGEMPLEVQPKLLRILQDGEFYKLGGQKIIKTDVRLIAATNRDLRKEVAQGKFRADLLYRLNTFPITLPALRERLDDIPLLVEHFVAKLQKKLGKEIETVSPHAIKSLTEYHWPGNIRELENEIERAIILAKDSVLQIFTKQYQDLHSSDLSFTDNSSGDEEKGVIALNDAERRAIINALEKTKWQISGEDGAAKLLKINPNTLRSKMIRLGIDRD